jgi:copper homeostasis protein
MARSTTAETVHLEVPVFGPASAALAVAAGAHRIELNAAESYPAGGLTPTVDDLRRVQDELRRLARPVPVRVMIRPRGAPGGGGAGSALPGGGDGMDFLYTAAETDAMEAAVREFCASGLLSEERGDGFVFGPLRWAPSPGHQPVLAVDVDCCQRLVRAAGPLKSVFHRAFDEVIGNQTQRQVALGDGNIGGEPGDASGPGWEAALDELVSCGFDGVLTSGGPGNAVQNVATMRRVRERAQGQIEVIVGGGVRSTNVRELVVSLGMQGGGQENREEAIGWVHSSCLTKAKEEEMVDEEEVTRILAAVV